MNGYKLRNEQGDLNLKKFINSLDCSLDLYKIKDVYERVYRKHNFSTKIENKEYSNRVINVTFKYSIKKFNRINSNIYIKYGYNKEEIIFIDGICKKNGKIIGIQTNEKIYNPIDSNELKECGFIYNEESKQYEAHNIETVLEVEQIRKEIYKDGFICDGIKFVRLSRSSGSSRVGKCLFIDERLYKMVSKWQNCGITHNKDYEGDLAGWESSISLTSSSIIDTLEINANNILIIDDYDSVFKDKAVVTKFNTKTQRLESYPDEVEISNSIWDGQSLMDSSLFNKYSNYGMLLLRNRFFKSCCFNTNLQQWFVDNNIVDVSQLNGYTQAKTIQEIKLVTTPNSIKYLKFGSLEDWLWTLDPMFGVVKHEKPTHYFDGRLVQTHYQLLNTLQLTYEETEELLRPSLEYLSLIKSNPSVLRHHIKFQTKQLTEPAALNSKNDIIYTLLGINEKFSQTKLYYDFRSDLVKSFKKNLRKGHILVKGNYSTLCGNPMEMLKATIGAFDGSSTIPIGTVHNTNFTDGEELLGSRSPHVTIGNILLTKNKINEQINKYFNFTKEIICVNSIKDNLLERLSGSDFDSDNLLLTNNKILIKAAKRNYDKFLVPTKMVKAIVTKRKFTAECKAELDSKIAVNKIGEIINLSQELNSKFWDKVNNGISFEKVQELYNDICQLDVMSNLDIDNAKRENPADNVKELKLLKQKYEERDSEGRYIRPKFFMYLDKDKGYYDKERKAYKYYDTTMDYVERVINRYKLPKHSPNECIPFSEVLLSEKKLEGQVYYPQVHRIISLVENTQNEIKAIWNRSSISNSLKFLLSAEKQQSMVEYINGLQFSHKTMWYLLKSIEKKENSHIKKLMFNILFGSPNTAFFEYIKISQKPIYELIESNNGDIHIYDFSYKNEIKTL